MALTRLSISVADAQKVGALSDLLEAVDPAPKAQSIFRDDPAGGWRLDAYFDTAPVIASIVDAARANSGDPDGPAEYRYEYLLVIARKQEL